MSGYGACCTVCKLVYESVYAQSSTQAIAKGHWSRRGQEDGKRIVREEHVTLDEKGKIKKLEVVDGDVVELVVNWDDDGWGNIGCSSWGRADRS